MIEWCMENPWLTFWIIIIALFVFDNVVANVVKCLNNRLRARLAEKGIQVCEKQD